MTAVPIPQRLAHRPVQGGQVVPWVALELSDGTWEFRGCQRSKVEQCFTHTLCQVCGQHITGTVVFFFAEQDLADMTTDVPPVHPECAAYSVQTCPILTGRLKTYTSMQTRAERTTECTTPGCDCGGYIKVDTHDRTGVPAPTWMSVWCRHYAALRDDDGRVWGAKVINPLKVRPVRTDSTATGCPA